MKGSDGNSAGKASQVVYKSRKKWLQSDSKNWSFNFDLWSSNAKLWPPGKYQCFKKSTPSLSLTVSTVLWCHRVAKPSASASFQVETQNSKNFISASKSVKSIWLMMVESTKRTLPVYRFWHFSTINALIPWLMGQIVYFCDYQCINIHFLISMLKKCSYSWISPTSAS